jgi:predicted O-methyltransferase YrrM
MWPIHDDQLSRVPPTLEDIRARADAINFPMSCEDKTGALLAALVGSKPAARALELGTGAGVSTAWLLSGLDAKGRLESVDSNAELVGIAREFLGSDPRVAFAVEDGEAFLRRLPKSTYDFIFADTWPGKFYALEECLALLAPGGLYVIDDLLPQTTWPEGHGQKVVQLIAMLEQRADLALVKLNWASGIIIASKRS